MEEKRLKGKNEKEDVSIDRSLVEIRNENLETDEKNSKINKNSEEQKEGAVFKDLNEDDDD